MRKESILIVIFLFAFAFSVNAEQLSKETIFRNCIEAKITKSEHKCDLSATKAVNVARTARKGCNDQVFLEKNKDKLTSEMVAKNVPLKCHAVDYYLIKTYPAGERGR